MAHVIACDIGGTSCRLALFSVGKGRIALEDQAAMPTCKVAMPDDLVFGLEFAFGSKALQKAASICASVAGPVEGGRASLTNARLELSEEGLSQALGGKPCRLANDFEAVSGAVLTEEGARAELVQGEPCAGQESCVRACCGAGTGFGCSAILPQGSQGGGALLLSSEGGHAAFPFTHDEAHYQEYLARELKVPYPSVEDVLSGRGLEALAKYLGLAGMDAAKLGEKVLGLDEWWVRSPVMLAEGRGPRAKRELCSSYARFYGRACRDWMLATLCRGGLWIAGGIAVKNRNIVRSKAFRDELVQGRHARMLKTMPVYLFNTESAGLWGAARLAAELI